MYVNSLYQNCQYNIKRNYLDEQNSLEFCAQKWEWIARTMCRESRTEVLISWYTMYMEPNRWTEFQTLCHRLKFFTLPDIFLVSLNELGRQCAYNQEQWVWSYGALCTCCQATGQGYLYYVNTIHFKLW